jgi:hypothetical protein
MGPGSYSSYTTSREVVWVNHTSGSPVMYYYISLRVLLMLKDCNHVELYFPDLITLPARVQFLHRQGSCVGGRKWTWPSRASLPVPHISARQGGRIFVERLEDPGKTEKT